MSCVSGIRRRDAGPGFTPFPVPVVVPMVRTMPSIEKPGTRSTLVTERAVASTAPRRAAGFPVWAMLSTAAVLSCALLAGEAPVPLGSAATYAVLAGSSVTSTGGTTLHGDLGISTGTALSGFLPGSVDGSIHLGDTVAAQAQADLAVAYDDAAGRPFGPDLLLLAGNIGGQTLYPGLYRSSSSLAVSSGDLTLDAGGDPEAVFIFTIATTLTTTSGRQVVLSGGAKAANIFWQVGSSATLGTGSVFKGTILARQSITMATGAALEGRALARTGGVTLDQGTVVVPPSGPRPLVIWPLTRAPDGTVTLTIANTPGRQFVLQSSADLVTWTTVASPIPASSPYVTTDAGGTSLPLRFYRAFYP